MSLVDDVIQYYAARACVHDEIAGYANPEEEQLRASIKARYRHVFAGHSVLEIACGTGYWTTAIGEVAESVLAVDINPSVISQARDRCKHLPSVKFHIADAYTLKGVPSGFSAAFGCLWWSHMPKELIPDFLTAFHKKLLPGASVLFVDQLPYEGRVHRQDSFGNTLEQRSLSGGRSFEVVKNFPTEEDIRNVLKDIANDVQYIKRPDEKSWTVTYKTKKHSSIHRGQ